MAFNNPQLFWLLLVIPGMIVFALATAFFGSKQRNRFASPELYRTLARSINRGKRALRTVLFFVGALCVIIALTEPRFGTNTEIIQRSGIDVVIALDTSYSMLAEDIKPNRIRQAKFEIVRLIDSLKGDSVGIIAFSGKSFVQCPLTTDYAAAKTLLESIDIGIISEPGTNLGDAIDGSVDLLDKGTRGSSDSRMIIFFTDGENLSGDPLKSAKKAADANIRIFTVGIGTKDGEIIPIRDERGVLEDYKKDSKGNVVKTALDEQTLAELARIGNGSYIRTVNGEVDIQTIIDQLGAMQKSDIHERKVSRLKERYQIPLGIGIFFLLLWLMIGERRKLLSDIRWSIS